MLLHYAPWLGQDTFDVVGKELQCGLAMWSAPALTALWLEGSSAQRALKSKAVPWDIVTACVAAGRPPSIGRGLLLRVVCDLCVRALFCRHRRPVRGGMGWLFQFSMIACRAICRKWNNSCPARWPWQAVWEVAPPSRPCVCLTAWPIPGRESPPKTPQFELKST